MALRDKATKTSKSSAGRKAKSRGLGGTDYVEKDPEQAVAERATMPAVTNQPPTPPPPNQYLSFFASIPSLRKQTGIQ